MAWLQVLFEASEEEAESYAEQLTALGAVAVTLEDAGDQPILEPNLQTTPLWRQTKIIGLFDAQKDLLKLRASLQRCLGTALYEGVHIEPLEDQDWQQHCQRQTQPMEFGERLLVCPTWDVPVETERQLLLLDPGLAFGTGTHPTTALCLTWLATEYQGTGRVIDYGCGSGILALAALKLGASQVYAVDHDEQALHSTERNGLKNGFRAPELQVCAPVDLPLEPVDVVVANILMNSLLSLASHLACLTRAGGRLVLSGILSEQVEKVIAGYSPWFCDFKVHQQDEWALIAATKYADR